MLPLLPTSFRRGVLFRLSKKHISNLPHHVRNFPLASPRLLASHPAGAAREKRRLYSQAQRDEQRAEEAENSRVEASPASEFKTDENGQQQNQDDGGGGREEEAKKAAGSKENAGSGQKEEKERGGDSGATTEGKEGGGGAKSAEELKQEMEAAEERRKELEKMDQMLRKTIFRGIRATLVFVFALSMLMWAVKKKSVELKEKKLLSGMIGGKPKTDGNDNGNNDNGDDDDDEEREKEAAVLAERMSQKLREDMDEVGYEVEENEDKK